MLGNSNSIIKAAYVRLTEGVVAIGLVFLLAVLWGQRQNKETQGAASRAQVGPGQVESEGSKAQNSSAGISSLKQKHIARYFAAYNQLATTSSLNIDVGGSGFKSSEALTDYMRLLRRTPVKKSVDLDSGDLRVGFFTSNARFQNLLIYPDPGELVAQLRKAQPNLTPTFMEEASGVSTTGRDVQSLGARVNLDGGADVITTSPGKESINSRVIGGDLFCQNSRCGLSLRGEGLTSDGGLRVLVVGGKKSLRPKFVIGAHDASNRFTWGLVDVDEDGQYDVSTYTSVVNNSLVEADVLYVATNDDGHWRLSYIHEHSAPKEQFVLIEPEPGEYKGPVVVRIYGNDRSGLAVSMDGGEPNCDVAAKAGKIMEELAIIVDKTSVISARPCGSSSASSGTLTARYAIGF